jgi:hypothetical protein
MEGTGDVTAISLYGLLDELSDASVHRSLSEVSPIFDDDRYNRLVLLGGDLNTWTGWNAPGKLGTWRAIVSCSSGSARTVLSIASSGCDLPAV